MKRRQLATIIALGFAVAMTACGDDSGSTATDTSGGTDTSPFADVTTTEDTNPSEDVTPGDDTVPAEDTMPMEDTTPAEDVAPIEDTAPSEDTAPTEDTAPVEDVPPMEDTVTEGCGTIEDLKASEEGPVNVLLCNMAVTYVYDQGYFIQASADSAAIGIYVGGDLNADGSWPYPAPAPGDLLNLQVTEFGSYNGLQQITASLDPVNMGTTDIGGFALDLSEGTLPSEGIESRLVKVTGIAVDEKAGKVLTISYGTAAGVQLYALNGEALCRNATFDLVHGIVTEYNGVHQLKTFDATLDVANLDDSGCAVDDSNWDFEDWTVTDPPIGFEKAAVADGFTITQDTEVFYGGAASAKITQTTEQTPELAQSWYMPATAGTTYTLSVWAWDNEPNLRARLVLQFYDGSGKVDTDPPSGKYSAYTQDMAEWQSLSVTLVAPEGATQLRGSMRFYDQNDFDPAVGASMNLDNWSVSVN